MSERKSGSTVEHQRAFGRLRAFDYLEDSDRHLSAKPEAELNIAVIGCGMMGREHIRTAQLLGRARVAGLYDPSEQSVAAALRLMTDEGSRPPRIYDSLVAACEDPQVDALFVATPNFSHLEVARHVLKTSKAVFIEKPIATCLADAMEICRLAKARDALTRIGLQYRYKANYAEAIHEVLERRALGEVHSVSMLEHRFPFLDKVDQWNKFDDRSGGTLVEKCCHYFDLLNLFSGSRATRVYASGSQAVNFKEFAYDNKRADVIDQAQVTVDYENGVIGSLSLCMFAPGTREEMIVCGNEGRLHTVETAELGEPNENRLELWRGENGASSVRTPRYPSYVERSGHHGSTFFEHVSFVEDVLAASRSGPSLADAFWSVAVATAAQESIRARRVVELAEVLPADFDERVL